MTPSCVQYIFIYFRIAFSNKKRSSGAEKRKRIKTDVDNYVSMLLKVIGFLITTRNFVHTVISDDVSF